MTAQDWGNIYKTTSNDFINCLVSTRTGKELARLQASKQFELYTGLEFPLWNFQNN